MTNDTDIKLSGPFKAKDANGREQEVKAIRIFDEGYGVIDVYVDFAKPLEKGQFRDNMLIGEINKKLHGLGYSGPDLSVTDATVQERKLIVLEAPEAFCAFAKKHGWKDLSEEFNDE